MGVANSNNPNYDTKLDNFFAVFTPGNANFGNIQFLFLTKMYFVRTIL